jgi:hypothetical protein
MQINSKWGSPDVIETDLRGALTPKSLAALQRLSVQAVADDEESKAQQGRDQARNRRIDYWGDRGTASWEEPDYEGDALKARQQASADIGTSALRDRGQIEGEQAAQFEPGAYTRKATGALESLRAEDVNYWDPRHQSRVADEYGRKLELATAPAATAASGRVNVAEIQANVQRLVAQGKLGPEVLTALARMTDAGVYGSDQYGTGLPPQPGKMNPTQQASIDAVQRMMSGAQGQQYSAEQEAMIKLGVDGGNTREATIAHLQALGRLPK